MSNFTFLTQPGFYPNNRRSWSIQIFRQEVEYVIKLSSYEKELTCVDEMIIIRSLGDEFSRAE